MIDCHCFRIANIQGQERVSGRPSAATGPWFVLMDEVLGQRSSTAPPVLTASIPEDTTWPSNQEEDDDDEEEEESQGPEGRGGRMEEDMRLQRGWRGSLLQRTILISVVI